MKTIKRHDRAAAYLMSPALVAAFGQSIGTAGSEPVLHPIKRLFLAVGWAAYSGLMLPAVTTRRHFSIEASICTMYSCGVEPIDS